jgi:hypothetical protein
MQRGVTMAKTTVPEWVWLVAGFSGLAVIVAAAATAAEKAKSPVYQCHKCGYSPVAYGAPCCPKCNQVFEWEPRNA